MKTFIPQFKLLIASITIIILFSSNLTAQDTNPDCKNTCTKITTITSGCPEEYPSSPPPETINIGCNTDCPEGGNYPVTVTCANGSTSTNMVSIAYLFNDGNCCICQCSEFSRLDCCKGGGCCEVCGYGEVCTSLSEEKCCADCNTEVDNCCEACSFATNKSCPYNPGQGSASNASVSLIISLGKKNISGNAGYLKIKEKYPSTTLATTKSLRYKKKWGVRVINDSSKNLRQIIAPQAFVDIVTLNEFKYEIRFYNRDKKGIRLSSGLFQPIGEPFTVWAIENPLADTNNINRLRITQYDSSKADVNDYIFKRDVNAWELAKGGGLQIVSATELTDSENKLRMVTRITKNDKNEIASKTVETYKTFYWGEEKLIKKVTGQDGAALTQIIEYYDDYKNIENKANLREKKLEINPDGSWIKYEYDPVYRKKRILSSWKDTDVYEAGIENSYSKEYSYKSVDPRDDSEDPGFYNKPRTVLEKIEGIPTGKTFYAYIVNDSLFTEIKEKCITPSSGYGNPLNQRKVIKKYIRGVLRNQVKEIIFPDGRIDTYTYVLSDKQNIEEGEVQGKYIRCITINHGTLAYREGIPYKTTQESSYYDKAGNEIEKDTYVYTGAGSYSLITTETSEYDKLNNMVKSVKNGSIKEETWNNYNKIAERDEQGVKTTYTYDLLGRVKTEVKQGCEETELYPAQEDITTSYVYDAEGRTLKTIRTAGDIRLSSATEYGLAGRVTKTIDEAGLVTTHQYMDDGRTEIITFPGGATKITKKYRDGKLKSISGTAVMHEYFEYGVTENGNQWDRHYFGSSDNSSEKWVKTTKDALGRVVKTEKQGFYDTIVTQNFYDHKSQLVKSTSCCSAGQLYEYNELGEQIRSGLDVDNNGKLELASMDRITEYDSYYSKEKGGWFKISKTITYPEDKSSKAVVVLIEKERLTGFGKDLVREREIIDINGNATVQKEYLLRDNKLKKAETKYPDSETPSIQVFKNDLLVSSLTRENLLYTYEYDALGRQTGIVDPRIGSSKTIYNARGQVSATIDTRGNKTEYFYDSRSGQQVKTKGPLGQISYIAYTPKGEIFRKWGAWEYPVQFTYDKFGNMIELYTYRGNGNYNPEEGPFDVIKADTTRWKYDEKTGLLLSKVYADGKGIEYSYSNEGKLIRREWARKVKGEDLVTNYFYDPATGEILKIDYSDSTADITYKYNRAGKPVEIKDAFGLHVFSYNDKAQLIEEVHDGTYKAKIIRKYDEQGRNAGFIMDSSYAVKYAYDGYGRLHSIVNGEDTFRYSFLKNSSLIECLKMPNGLTTTKTYGSKSSNMVSIENKAKRTVVSKYMYAYDELNRRVLMVTSGTAFDQESSVDYTYNKRSELTSAVESANSVLNDSLKRNYAYEYDNIGNRISYTGNKNGTTHYTSNSLNQYTKMANPDVHFEYDADGNMAFDGKWKYTWNAENRLVQAKNDSLLLQFAYDYMGRRFSKKVLKKEKQEWVPIENRYFVYDDWNLIKEHIIQFNNKSPENQNTKLYTWGLDLSQSLQGAGGVGGLLSVKNSVNDSYYYYCYDANGNVGQLVNGLGAISGKYEYSPFGQKIVSVEAFDLNNHFGFSTKYSVSEIKLLYYGYRFYNLNIGRWMNKDPLAELGSINLYLFLNNNTLNNYDIKGLINSLNIRILYISGGLTRISRSTLATTLGVASIILAAANCLYGIANIYFAKPDCVSDDSEQIQWQEQCRSNAKSTITSCSAVIGGLIGAISTAAGGGFAGYLIGQSVGAIIGELASSLLSDSAIDLLGGCDPLPPVKCSCTY